MVHQHFTLGENLTVLDNSRILGVERIDLGGTNILRLAASDLLALSDTTNTLFVDGDGADEVRLLASDAWSGPSAPVDGYVTYTQGSAVLKVDADIVNIVFV